MKPICFVGSALEDIRRFPDVARRRAGFQLDRIQRGLAPDDWKPMPGIGSGVREVRIRDTSGAYRAIYVAHLADAIYVLHEFAERTQRTSRADLDLAGSRHRQIGEV